MSVLTVSTSLTVLVQLVLQGNILIMTQTNVNVPQDFTSLMEPAPNVKMVGNTTQLHNVVSGKTHVLPTKF